MHFLNIYFLVVPSSVNADWKKEFGLKLIALKSPTHTHTHTHSFSLTFELSAFSTVSPALPLVSGGSLTNPTREREGREKSRTKREDAKKRERQRDRERERRRDERERKKGRERNWALKSIRKKWKRQNWERKKERLRGRDSRRVYWYWLSGYYWLSLVTMTDEREWTYISDPTNLSVLYFFIQKNESKERDKNVSCKHTLDWQNGSV